MGVKEKLAWVKQHEPGANHYVYAFMIGWDRSSCLGMSDDGEPPGTAGRPLLEVVKGAGLGDLLVIVVRFFGGTKLGTGGLVKAYTLTGQKALALCGKKLKLPWLQGRCSLDYDKLNYFEKALEEFQAELVSRDFHAVVDFCFMLPVKFRDKLDLFFQNLTNGSSRIDWGDL